VGDCKNEKGQPLNKFELLALVERWCALFGELPPADMVGQASATPAPLPAEPTPADNAMMTRADVARELRASISTVQRMEKDGCLPRPLRTGRRSRRHLVRDVNALMLYPMLATKSAHSPIPSPRQAVPARNESDRAEEVE
jgi:predicted DNA-binding transcriptional regulator AlpA